MDFDIFRPAVVRRVSNRFSSDAVDVVLHERVEVPRQAAMYHPERRTSTKCETPFKLSAESVKMLGQPDIYRRHAAKVLDGLACLVECSFASPQTLLQQLR